MISAAILCIASSVVVADEPKLEGTWVCIKGERNGEESEQPKGSKMILKEGKLTLIENESGREQKGSYKVDNTKTPNQITLTPDNPEEARAKEFLGIYQIKDGKLTLVVAGPEVMRPTEFTTKPGDMCFLMVFELEKE